MITIAQLLAMPCGERIGGGFILTVKSTKKYVYLPEGHPIYTVVLFDNTGEMLADFKGAKGTYTPLIKGEQIKIIVAEIQAADPSSNKIVLKEGKKLFVDQFERLTQTLSEYEDQMVSYQEDWDRQIEGKCRHGLTCAYIRAGKEPNKDEINKWVKFIMTGE